MLSLGEQPRLEQAQPVAPVAAPVAVPAQPAQPAQPAPAAAPDRAPPPPLHPPVEPRVNSEGHAQVISLVLPHLRAIMLHPEHCGLQPRQQVHRSLMAVDRQGNRFWGAHQTYTRKRTVEDLVLQFYFDDVRRRL